MRVVLTLLALSLAGCGMRLGASEGALTCDGGPSFDPAILEGPGGAEKAANPAAEALRRHLAIESIDIDWLPDNGWIQVARSDSSASYLAPDPASEGSWMSVSVGRDGDAWKVKGWGGCNLQPDVGLGMGIASFRVAPDVEVDPAATEIPILVTERDCNSGEDATGRIVVSSLEADETGVTAVIAVRPRLGGQTCPSNPETPFVLQLPEPLGDRALFDGSSVPPRDATVCPAIAMCE